MNWDTFRQLVSIAKNDDDVYLEFDFEVLVLTSSTRVNLREQHICWDFDIANTVSISYLNVLNFGCACLPFERLYTYQLNLN